MEKDFNHYLENNGAELEKALTSNGPAISAEVASAIIKNPLIQAWVLQQIMQLIHPESTES